MIQSCGSKWRRYLSRLYLSPKYVLLLTVLNSAAEGVVATGNCAARTSEISGFLNVDVEGSGLQRSYAV